MRTSAEGVEFISSYEGFVGQPYNDPAVPPNCTIGYGHLIHRGPCTKADRQKWGTITAAEGRSLLFDDLERFEQAVHQLVTTKLTQGQFDALVSFAYNVGAGNLKSSTLLKKVNARHWRQARYQFLRWVFSGGKPLPGLIRRRKAESDMFWKARPRKPRVHRRDKRWGGSRYYTRRAIEIVGKRAPVTSRKRWELFGNPSSDHYRGNKLADAVDFGTPHNFALRDELARKLGIKDAISDYTHYFTKHDGRTYRHQFIASNHGTGPHLHYGVKRVD